MWSPTEANRARFGETLAEHVDAEVVVADTMDAALAGADLLTTVTRAREPFLGRDELAGVASLHINAMGAVLAHSAEMQHELVEGADVVAVDSLDNARRGSRELTESFGAGLEGVRTLGDLVRSGYRRPASARLTIFKGMGTGLADLAAASVLARNAELEWTTT